MEDWGLSLQRRAITAAAKSKRDPTPGGAGSRFNEFRIAALFDLHLTSEVAHQPGQRARQRAHGRDHGNRDAGGDEAILDGRGTRLVLDEACNRSPHVDTPFGSDLTKGPAPRHRVRRWNLTHKLAATRYIQVKSTQQSQGPQSKQMENTRTQ
jgi:hypothetical protein